MSVRLFSFVGSDTGIFDTGTWDVIQMNTCIGEPLPQVAKVNVISSAEVTSALESTWCLRGIMSNERYVERSEKNQLLLKQQGLGRPDATRAALIPIRKNAAWWALTQDERREIFETQSHHNQIGMNYLPAIARRLHHCRDLSENEPFDFITWFEYAPEHEVEFNNLLHALRITEEWKYVEREVDIRLQRA